MIASGDVVETGSVEPSWNKKNGSAYQLNVVCSRDSKIGTEVVIERASRKHQSTMHVHFCSLPPGPACSSLQTDTIRPGEGQSKTYEGAVR